MSRKLKMPAFDPSRIVLARVPRKYDHRDLLFREFITPAMRARAAQVTAMDWAVDHVLDQGTTPHCVGFAWATFGITLPVFDNFDNSMGDKIYYAAKIIDGEPNAEDGSSTLSGVKAFMQFAKLENDSYAFASNLNDIVTWVLANGPVIAGTDWLNGMFYPDADGLVHVDYTNDQVAGGHEWNISGADTVARQFHCTNTWGVNWGVNGHFKIGFDDFMNLFDHQGDACTAAEVSTAPVPAPTPTPTPSPVPVPPGCLPAPVAKLLGYSHPKS